MQRLRGPGGCPWITSNDPFAARVVRRRRTKCRRDRSRRSRRAAREIGDLLFEGVFLGRLRGCRPLYGADSLRSVHREVDRRHPHVFGDEEAGDRPRLTRPTRGRAMGRDQAREQQASGESRSLCSKACRSRCPRCSGRTDGTRVAAVGFAGLTRRRVQKMRRRSQSSGAVDEREGRERRKKRW